jgi:tRNA(fMet)-specific endonuclease VapC
MIPQNDIWIAAVARQWDLALVTRDVHYQFVNDLRIEAW